MSAFTCSMEALTLPSSRGLLQGQHVSFLKPVRRARQRAVVVKAAAADFDMAARMTRDHVMDTHAPKPSMLDKFYAAYKLMFFNQPPEFGSRPSVKGRLTALLASDRYGLTEEDLEILTDRVMRAIGNYVEVDGVNSAEVIPIKQRGSSALAPLIEKQVLHAQFRVRRVKPAVDRKQLEHDAAAAEQVPWAPTWGRPLPVVPGATDREAHAEMDANLDAWSWRLDVEPEAARTRANSSRKMEPHQGFFM
eukprot:jgi/Mesvir1/19591/Mv09892-RA.1